MIHSLKQFTILCMLSLFFSSCVGQANPTRHPARPGQTVVPSETSAKEGPAADLSPTSEPAPPVVGVNPLTGLLVQEPALLDLPAALVSIAHFPVEARPQSGLSYAPWVFEVYITEGATRFLATFYGEFPAPEPFITGSCKVRTSPFIQSDILLGNRVWLDANQNHIQDAWESGIGGVCVNLYDVHNTLLQQTTTDSHGYYAFNVTAGEYFIEVVKPDGMEFDQTDIGDKSKDSDVDQATGWSEALNVTSTLLDVDAGLAGEAVLNGPSSASELAIPFVGPVRSGRLVYADIANFFPGSCLIFAYASTEVLVELPTCSFVDHILYGGGYLLEINKMKQLVEERKNANTVEYYASNIFSPEVPEGGVPANRLDVYFAWLNQSAWAYDAASQSWWRYVDNADEQTAGILHPEVDRLNNRQLQFENVIVLFAYHDVVSPTNLKIHLEQDWVGDALLFRDGQMYKIRWSTVASEEEINTGNRRPIRFFSPDDKTPFPLKPGHTWITVVTPLTAVTETSAGNWLLQFSQPVGAK
ncbi:MAG TPA: SdrD B-like domain-containing protein [Anaerolineales bacterium]|nr:SdrD B-like domain-containing protein [Anaerolineales bacterium]